MKPRRVPIILALVLVLAVCSAVVRQLVAQNASSSTLPAPISTTAPAGGGAVAPALSSERMPDQFRPEGDQVAASQPAAEQQGFSRLVIKTADLSLEVNDVRVAEAAVRRLATQLGGYVVRVESNGTDEQLTTRITFRVPAERFDDALTGVQGLAQKIVGRTISGDDVTEEFVDLESRLRNLEATRDRLLTFLDKATRVEDALSVNTSLSEIQGQIEQIRGRMQYLKQSAALSTITVFLAPVPVTPLVAEGGWQPLEVARGALRSLIELGQGLATVAIVLLVWTPVWLPLLLLGLWARRRFWARPGKPGGPAAPEAA
jgi:hypothetical protein